MIDAIPTWLYVVGASLSLLAAGAVPMLHLFGVLKFRTRIQGGPETIAPKDPSGLYSSYYRQLIALGFKPLGEYVEGVPMDKSFTEQAFTHPEFSCRASIFLMGGEEPKVCVKTEFENGQLVKVFNYSGDEVSEPTLIVRRRATHSLAKIMRVHQHARFKLVNSGETPIGCETLEQWRRAEEKCFYHPLVRAEFLNCQKTIAGVTITLAASKALVLAVVLRVCLNCTFAQAFFVASFAGVGLEMILQRINVNRAIVELERERDTADAKHTSAAS